MYTIDASVFVRDLDPTEPEHAVCQTLLERLDVAGLPIIVPVLLLVERAGTVSRTRRDPLRARVVVLGLRGLPHLTLVDLDDALAQEAAGCPLGAWPPTTACAAPTRSTSRSPGASGPRSSRSTRSSGAVAPGFSCR